jgi:RNA polymerase sigma factor (sigma-70 family)
VEPRPGDLTDAQLVSLCRQGDSAAWDALVERFSRYVYAITTQAFRLSQHDAEDVFQDVFARTYTQLHTLRDDAAIRPWIAQTTRRLAIDRLRRDGRETPVEELPEESHSTEAIDRIDAALDLHRAMDDLPEHCKEILDRFFARDESYLTIAAELDIPSGTIASRISRCLNKLRADMQGR